MGCSCSKGQAAGDAVGADGVLGRSERSRSPVKLGSSAPSDPADASASKGAEDQGQQPPVSNGNKAERAEEADSFQGLVLADFEAEDPAELSVAANEQLTVLTDPAPEGWSIAMKDGVQGLVPKAYVVKMDQR